MNLQRIEGLIQQGRAREARDLCRSRCAQDPEDVMAWVLLAAAQLQLGETGEAEAAGRTAVTLNRDDSQAWNLLVQSLLRQNKLAEAIVAMRELLRLNPNSGQLHCRLAAMLAREGDLQGAIDQYRKALALDPGLVEAHVSLGHACMALAEYDDAIGAYQRLLALDPQNGAAHHDLGEALQAQGSLREAESSYREAIRLCPDRVEPHVNLGRVLLKLGRRQEAVVSQEKALEMDSRCASAYHNIALCLYDDKDLSASLRAFLKAADLNPSNELARCFAGILYLQQDDRQAGAAYIERARCAPFTASVVESYEYAARAAPQARFFGTSGQVLAYAVKKAAVDGLFLEFGVSYGTSITIIADSVERPVHGFDSFEGLPESWDVGDTPGVTPAESAGMYSTGGSPPPAPDNVVFHVGLFEDTLPGFVERHAGPVGFMNVDCDLYSSTRTVFHHLGGRIVPGTVIVFDEYFCYPEWRQHEYKAFQEFVQDRGVRYEYLAFSFFTGQAVVRILAIDRYE
jgi:tetratricopeptide (TPR) repeat protein